MLNHLFLDATALCKQSAKHDMMLSGFCWCTVLHCARFAAPGKQVVLRGLGENTGSGAEGEQIGVLFDDGQRDHDDRYPGDGLFSNTVFLEFKEMNVSVYKEFYVSLLDKFISTSVEIAGKCKICSVWGTEFKGFTTAGASALSAASFW
jgi:hypothetical protein